jgi:hypothetical protein
VSTREASSRPSLEHLGAPASRAGIADTPLLPGTNYLFSVPGVVNSNGLGTIFTCTSVSTSAETVTVQVSDETGAVKPWFARAKSQ